MIPFEKRIGCYRVKFTEKQSFKTKLPNSQDFFFENNKKKKIVGNYWTNLRKTGFFIQNLTEMHYFKEKEKRAGYETITLSQK